MAVLWQWTAISEEEAEEMWVILSKHPKRWFESGFGSEYQNLFWSEKTGVGYQQYLVWDVHVKSLRYWSPYLVKKSRYYQNVEI